MKSKFYFCLILSTFAFCLFTFYFSCKRDFSALSQKIATDAADTTSHDFVWRIDTIGTHSSYLLDVAVISENEAWAVGEIHTADTDTFDSLGNWIPPYNAVRWNGQEWELKRILYQGGFWTIRSIFAFSSNDIWFGAIVRWNGFNFIEMAVPGIFIGHRISKMWGTSANDLYAVGTEGLIAHYDGSSWQELDSGTEVDIQDIWGAMNPQSGEWEILAVASFSIGVPQAKKLLRIDGTTVSTVQDSGLPLALETIWFVPGKEYFIGGGGGGAGVFHTNAITQGWKADMRQPVFYMFSIRGLRINDMLMAGGHGYISHYNGATSRLYTGTELPEFFGNYYSVAVHPDVVAAVGSYGVRQGVVAVGRRSTQP